MRCPICGKILGEMNKSHAKLHGMTLQEILDKYPELKTYRFLLRGSNRASSSTRYKQQSGKDGIRSK